MKRLIAYIYYAPEHLPSPPARAMRCFHFWMLVFTIIPGIPVAWVLRNSVAWVVLVSMVTWSATHLGGFSAERPSEIEDETLYD